LNDDTVAREPKTNKKTTEKRERLVKWVEGISRLVMWSGDFVRHGIFWIKGVRDMTGCISINTGQFVCYYTDRALRNSGAPPA
jgi:hypothetical protein